MDLLDELDFENFFTMSMATIYFYILSAIAVIAYFVALWSASGSLFTTVFVGLLLGLCLAIPAGAVLAVASLILALLTHLCVWCCRAWSHHQSTNHAPL